MDGHQATGSRHRTQWKEYAGYLWWAAFFSVLAVAATLRLTYLERDEVRTDEGNYAVRAIGWNDFMFSTSLGSAWIWHQGVEVLPTWTQLSFNDHPPLHFAAIWVSTRLFGIKLWAVRLPSALYGVGAVVLLMLLLDRGRRSFVPIAAGLVLALLPWHIFISRQAIQESGVIFWMLAAIYLAGVINEVATSPPRLPWAWWVSLGMVLALGVLTKYSAVLVIFPLTYHAIRARWLRRRAFWVLPFTFGATLLPLAWYNWQVYLLRGHPDLQLSRLMGQNTSNDWPASHQAIWQGSLGQVWDFFQNQALGLSWPAVAILFAGCWWVFRKRDDATTFLVRMSFGAAAVGATISLISLNDFGRSAVLLAFYLPAFGLSLMQLPIRAQLVAASTVIAVLIGAIIPLKNDTVAPQRLVKTFWSDLVGYTAWEEWRERHLPTNLRPRHYASLVDWLQDQLGSANNDSRTVVIMDNRISWFASNWYFFRYAFYATDATFMNAGIFAYLNWQDALPKLRGRPIWYVQVGPAALDSKAVFDEQSRATDDFFRTLAEHHTLGVHHILGHSGHELFTVWQVTWDPAVDFPAAQPPKVSVSSATGV